MMYADKCCKVTEEFDDGTHIYIYSGKCVLSGVEHEVRIPANELFAYRQGQLIQDALKSVSAADREFLISGISPDAWDREFSDL